MVMINCPRCQVRIGVNPNDVDISHRCNSGVTALDFEDVRVEGNFEDSDGTTGTVGPYQVKFAGLANSLWGTRAWVEDQDNEERTSRGRKISYWRERQHFEHIKIKKRLAMQSDPTR